MRSVVNMNGNLPAFTQYDRFARSGLRHYLAESRCIRTTNPATVMTSNSARNKKHFDLLILVCLACLAGSGGLLAQDAGLIAIGKERFFVQEEAGGAVPEEINPYGAFAFLEASSPGSIFSSPAPTLTLPGLDPFALRPEDENWDFEEEYPDRATLDSMVPNGVYTIAFTGATAGPVSGNLNMTGDAYPNAPVLADPSFNALQSGNLATGFTLGWAPFQGGTADDFIGVFIAEINAPGESVVFETEPFDLNGTVTSLPISAGTLSNTGGYEIGITFFKIVDTATIGGTEAFALYSSHTCLVVGDTSREQLSLNFFHNTGSFDEPADLQVTTNIFPIANPRYNLFYGFDGAAANFPDKSLVTFGAPFGSPFDGAVAVDFFGPSQGAGFGGYTTESATVPTDGSGSGTYTASLSGVEAISREVDFALLLDQNLIVVPTVKLNGDGTIQSIDITYKDSQNQDPSSLGFIQSIGTSLFGMDFSSLYEEFTGLTTRVVPPSGIAWNDVQRLRFSYFTDLQNNYDTEYAKGITPLESDAFDGTDIPSAPGWRTSPWYSAYNADFWPWIFHAEHGWQYIFETEVHGEVFIYDLESQAYWWASSAFEPLTFYSFDRGSFNFYFGGTTGPRQFVDLQTGEFWSIP